MVSEQATRKKQRNVKEIIPWFIIWFIVASILSSIDLVPKVVLPYLKDLSHLFMAHGLGRNRKQGFLQQFRAAGAALF